MSLEANSKSEDKIACSVTCSGELLQSKIEEVISVALIATAVGLLTVFRSSDFQLRAYSIEVYLSA
jgi:hypothetical protein